MGCSMIRLSTRIDLAIDTKRGNTEQIIRALYTIFILSYCRTKMDLNWPIIYLTSFVGSLRSNIIHLVGRGLHFSSGSRVVFSATPSEISTVWELAMDLILFYEHTVNIRKLSGGSRSRGRVLCIFFFVHSVSTVDTYLLPGKVYSCMNTEAESFYFFIFFRVQNNFFKQSD